MMNGRTGSRRGWIAYAAAWIPPAVIYALAIALQDEATFSQALLSAAVTMGIAALAGVPVWRLSGRLAVHRPGPARFYAIHLLLALAYGLLWTVTHTAWLWLVAGAEVAAYVWNLAAPWQIVMGVVLYGVIAGLSYLIRTQRRLREQELAAARAETAAVQARFRALRAQLNPHFLFNAIHSLSTLVRHDPAAAEAALEHLGDLLRYALEYGSEDLVRFGTELDFTRSYVELESLRFGDRLRVEYDIDDDALELLVPPFLLQPLVENAIRHGLAPRAGRGTLAIAARYSGGRLTLTVRDDGRGATADAFDDADGLGLRVLRRQLETRYGQRAGIDIETAPDAGFRVVVSLPVSASSPGLVHDRRASSAAAPDARPGGPRSATESGPRAERRAEPRPRPDPATKHAP